ncbi:MAG TPA: AMP-binding protein, partial [Hyphomonadaceae bacterium]|nr:AMP-binding protein [Hyphomonadaceae bacterium]
MVERAEAIRTLTAPGQPFEIEKVKVWGRDCLWFKNGPPTLRQLYETTRSDKPFIIYESERLSFEDIWRRSCRLATVLLNDYGVRKGDRVAISMRNYPEWMIAFCATTSIGAIAVAMNAMWQPNEMEYALNDSRPRVLIVDPERLERFLQCEKAPRDVAVIVTRATKAPPAGIARLEGYF